MTDSMLRIIALLPALLIAAIPSGVAAQGRESSFDCLNGDCAGVLPGADTFERAPDGPYWVGLDTAGEPVGWVAVSTDIVDIKGYSSKPLVTLVGLGTDGVIRGARVVSHSEPILLVGIPESALHAFTDKYVGLLATTKVSVGGTSDDPDAVLIDAISGATVTVLAEDRTIMETARQLGVATGVVERPASVPGHFVEREEVWDWRKLKRSRVFGRLTVKPEDVGEGAYHYGVGEEGEPFIDLWFTIADAPNVGRALLGEREYKWAMDQLAEGEHLFVMFGNGVSSFRGSGFVRGGIFDRFRLEQGLTTVMFTDRDYHRLRGAEAVGAPEFNEAAWFRTPAGMIDPGLRFKLVFLASQFSGEGGFDRIFSSFGADHRLPRSVYRLDGPDPEQEIWRAAWRASPWKTWLVSAMLLTVIGFFIARRWLTADTKRLKRIHIGTQVVSVIVLGFLLKAQPSVTQVLTFADSVVREWRWDLFLSEPLLVVSWIFITVVTIAWGRGVFCGWTCPYGALTEIIFLISHKLGVPEFELPERWHRPALWIRYGIFAALLGTFLVSSPLGEKMAEVEPFKSTFFVPIWTRHWGFIAWWVLLLVASAFTYRPFCRYICPLGAALAVPSSVRVSGPHRRDFCTQCKICTVRCEPRAIRPNGTIDSRECLSCMECEANYRDKYLCPPLVQIRKAGEKAEKARAGAVGEAPGRPASPQKTSS